MTTGFAEVVKTQDLQTVRTFLKDLPKSSYMDFAADWMEVLSDPATSSWLKTYVKVDLETASMVENILLSEIDGKTVVTEVCFKR